MLERAADRLTLEAFYDREDQDFHGLELRAGDRFVETHYADRWYNVFAIHDVDSDELKGWYCNITRPASLGEADIWSVDLALDLVVLPEGSWVVLDEDEFAELGLSEEERAQAMQTLEQLRRAAQQMQGEFSSPLD